jgi:hypothetical protein
MSKKETSEYTDARESASKMFGALKSPFNSPFKVKKEITKRTSTVNSNDSRSIQRNNMFFTIENNDKDE